MTSLIFIHGSFGLLALLVVLFVAYPYRGRTAPRAARLTQAVAAVVERVDPGESPPLGVLSTPEKSRRISRRIELAERQVRRRARALTTLARSS